MLDKAPQFNAMELFDSLPNQEKRRINSAIQYGAEKRAEERYSCLHNAEISRNKLIQELEEIGLEIAENDAWFIAAKEGKLIVTTDELNLHKIKAEKLYSSKKSIEKRLLESDLAITAIVNQIEAEECQEGLFERKDLDQLLNPFYEEREGERLYEEREREREQIILAQINYGSLSLKPLQDAIQKYKMMEIWGDSLRELSTDERCDRVQKRALEAREIYIHLMRAINHDTYGYREYDEYQKYSIKKALGLHMGGFTAQAIGGKHWRAFGASTG